VVIAPQISSFLALLELSITQWVKISKFYVKNFLQEYTSVRQWEVANHVLSDSPVNLVVLIAHFVIMALTWMMLRLAHLFYQEPSRTLFATPSGDISTKLSHSSTFDGVALTLSLVNIGTLCAKQK
jgi:hypothetical protein